MIKKTVFTAIISIGLLAAFRCGVYSFSGSTLPPHIKTVGIPIFEDHTAEFGIDQKITDLLIDAIRDDNTLKIADPDRADALLHGVITGIRDPVGQYDANEEASDFRVYISITVTFEDVHNRSVMWETSFSDYGTYVNDRDAGIEEAVNKIAEDIINKTVSDW
ncbi:hypothetical protein JW948_09725 [bacterium]|nr:hypothetical protein [bacterium]